MRPSAGVLFPFLFILCRVLGRSLGTIRRFGRRRRPAFRRTPTASIMNIGQEIQEELQRQERTVSWLARKLGCNRVAVYRIMQKNSIDTSLLQSISVALHRNFFSSLSHETEQRLYENDTEAYQL